MSRTHSLELLALTTCLVSSCAAPGEGTSDAVAPASQSPQTVVESDVALTEPSTPPGPPVRELGAGEVAQVSETDAGACRRYAELVVLERENSILVDRRERAPDCNMSGEATELDVFGDSRFHGVLGAYLVMTEHTGSDWYDVSIRDAHGAEVRRLPDVPPTASFGIDLQRRELVFGKSLSFPDACAQGLRSYAERERACWSTLQNAHPPLLNRPAPECDCGPSGLLPYPILHVAISLDDPSAAAVEELPLSCGCSS